jgi:periplasmic divalent cation tolerance protein
MNNEVVLALTTLPADLDAIPIAKELVGSGLAACVNIVPAVSSVYTWKGVPQVETEQQLLIKTTAERVDALWEAIRARHPYDNPEFIVVPVVGGSEEYLDWVEESVVPRKES